MATSDVVNNLHNSFANPGTTLILYVEDDPVNQHVLESCLANQHHMIVKSTAGADDTLQYLESVDYLPDLVLMDNQLIDTTGDEVRNAYQCITIAVRMVLMDQMDQTDSATRPATRRVTHTNASPLPYQHYHCQAR